ncbi:aldo-keto reductase family 1 member C3 homolog isoform X1 [Trachemys scripta elegans]|uniref:aldo-keto reductase family 1 member C3 homolog isoform X1 n=1 Tax=Trachemys scripta elegans TaxID=31138 RepID=UPI0015569F71|nr:aldo-keto reductase family 1 member C3 homolog isoform X1 [Trachemys scripta elegans]
MMGTKFLHWDLVPIPLMQFKKVNVRRLQRWLLKLASAILMEPLYMGLRRRLGEPFTRRLQMEQSKERTYFTQERKKRKKRTSSERTVVFESLQLGSTFHRPELVRNCLEQSLKKLKFDYLDLFIIHIPVSLKPGPDLSPMDENGKLIFDIVDLRQTWEAMEACKDAGLVKSIGVSNFNRRQLEMILNKPGLKYKPVCNQVECHPYLNQRKLLEFCKSKNIVLVAFSALGSHRDELWVDQSTPLLLEDPILNALAKKYSRSPALVALRYQLQRGVVVLAKSFTREHIEDNFKVFDFQLTEEDMKAIDSLNQNLRYDPCQEYLDHPEYPFADDY